MEDLEEDQAIRDRLSAAIAKTGAKQVADLTGIPLGTLNKYVAKSSGASFANVVKIAEATGTDLSSLAGSNSKFGMRSARVEGPSSTRNDIVRLPRFDARASAGRGLVPVNEMPIGEVAFGRDFLRNLGANPEYCYILEARGDSMWPTIPDGALLIADASKTEVDDGRIYHFNVMDRALVKRARWSLDGKLYLTSDNIAAGYPSEEFTADRIDELRVGGRIMFTGHAPMPVR